MLETRAKVVRLEGQHAWVEVDHVSGCEQCNGKGCGSSKLGQMFCSSTRQFQVINSIHAQIGDDVVVVVAEGVLLRGIGLAYLLPLLLLLAGAAFGSALASDSSLQDRYAVVGALLGLVVGIFLVRSITARRSQEEYFQPRLTGLYRGKP